MFDADNQYVIGKYMEAWEGLPRTETFKDNWEAENAKGFYTTRLRHSPSNVALSYGTVNSHIFVEFAGQACANLDSVELLNTIIERTHLRATRIDFAVDIKTDIAPKVFIEARSNKSFKSSGNKYSPSGETEYLGGRSSERMARVYRYHAPHPRHEYLRIETEYKGEAAKVAAKHLAETNVQQACLDAHHPFGWTHNVWNAGELTSTRIPYRAYRPNNASTLVWLYGTVVTSLRKATQEGILDIEEWLKFLRESLNDED